MSEQAVRNLHTPTTEAVRAKYARGTRSDGTHAQFVKWQKEFDRWLAAHDAEVLAAAGVAQPEPEYEYRCKLNPIHPDVVHEWVEVDEAHHCTGTKERRVKAGAWEPVPNQTGETP